MFSDFAIISGLLVAAHLLRANVRLLQNLFIPAPIIAGFLGLLGSEQVFGVLPFSTTGDGESLKVDMTAYPSYLVAMVFGSLFLGHQPRRPAFRTVLRETGDTFFYNLAAEIGQYGFALLFGVFVLAPLFPSLNNGFSIMMPAGFAGGHGTAAVVAGILENEGWDEALSIGQTFATIGLLSGIFGGLLLINIATRCKWTRLVKSAHELPESIRRGFLTPDEQTSMGRKTVSSMSLDPLAWHTGLVMCAFGGALLIDALSKPFLQTASRDIPLPLFALAMLSGAFIQFALERLGLGETVDRHVIVRVGSTVSDYLIAFGVASISLKVVVDHAQPLAIMSLFGVLYCVAMLWFLGRRIFHNYWFERSIFVFGWSTGIVAIGILLLRIVDPKFESRTLEDYGLAYLGISLIQIVMLVAIPILVVKEQNLPLAAGLIGVFAMCIALSGVVVGWFTAPPAARRPGEALPNDVEA
ncbi:MAG: sodium/glutamate symporter [Planctomycetaceae bacterium]